MTTARATIALLGFGTVQGFQTAYNLGPALTPDGIVGPLTTRAAHESATRRARGLPDISPHFSAHHFACHCGGTLPGCQRTVILRPLLVSLEVLYRRAGQVKINSGYRCPEHNKDEGGAKDSQHQYGSAADVDLPATFTMGRVQLNAVRAIGQFSGIGFKHDSRRVTHVDRRDISGHNSTHGTPAHPTTWTYPGR